MSTLTVTMFLSLDGVIQGPGGPEEDRRGGFERGGWVSPYAEEDHGRFIVGVFAKADAILLGRAFSAAAISSSGSVTRGQWPAKSSYVLRP